MKHLIGFILIFSVLAGCEDFSASNPHPPAPPSDSGGAKTSDRPVMAYVYGKPIYMESLTDILLSEYGLMPTRQLIATELVEHHARKLGVTVSDDDILAQQDRTLRQNFPKASGKRQRRELLAQYLAKNNISKPIWQMTMRRNTILRKLAEKKVVITDEMIEDEFVRNFGKQIYVRHIQLASAPKAQMMLEKLKEGAEFSELALKHSTHASGKSGGQLPPLGEIADKMPPAFINAAKALQNPGDLSEIVMVGSTFHIIRLDKITKPKKENIEKVRNILIAVLNEREIQRIQQEILLKLMKRANSAGSVVYENPIIKDVMQRANEGATNE